MCAEYRIDSRAYLLRGLASLERDTLADLFYAAFEFRCAAEARMQQYLEAWEHVPERQKNAWEMGKLLNSLSNAFSGDQLTRIHILEANQGEQIVLYYTPCRPRLKTLIGQLGGYLHAKQQFHSYADSWWTDFRSTLVECSDELTFSNTGTLIGPYLREPKTGLVKANVEILDEHSPILKKIHSVSARLTVDISYPDNLPTPLENYALVWSIRK